jgi:hypothetical protein
MQISFPHQPAEVLQMNDALMRAAHAKELGLPETSSWNEINSHARNLERKRHAQELGLPETSSWADINRHTMKASVA